MPWPRVGPIGILLTLLRGHTEENKSGEEKYFEVYAINHNIIIMNDIKIYDCTSLHNKALLMNADVCGVKSK